MAPIKRKNDAAAESSRPEKKHKSSTSTQKKSLLREEEPAFPRGGASILTPLEYKQIQIQAKQDVLFEQNTGQKAARNEFEDEGNDEDLPGQLGGPIKKSKNNSKIRDKMGKKLGVVEEVAVRIEGLSYKRLVPGSLVLAQISQINRYDLALNLPNNLTGYVSLTSISDKLTRRIEDLAADEEEADEQDAGRKVDLKKLFFVGQYLRAYVTSTQEEVYTGAKGKRHIELSINPREANSGLNKADYVTDCMVQASVHSVEDHGLVMDLGTEDAGFRGFMSSKELGSYVDTSSLEEGSVCLCLVTGKSSNGSIIKLSADPQKIGNVKKGNFLTSAPSVDSFLPGTAVEVLVSETTPSGIAGKVMGLLDVTADLIHSGAAASGKDLEKKYPTGSKVKGRIICTFPTADEKKLGISLQDHIVYWRPKMSTSASVTENTLPTEMLQVSTIVDEAKVVKVEQGTGLLVDVGVKGVRGFVHISKISDGKIETLSESIGAYKVGSVHKARIIGYNSMDGLFIVSMEPKVISQAFLRMEDVKIGQVVKGSVEKMLVNETGVNGVIVKIAEGITGLVPEIHLADIHLQHPEKRFKEGSSVTARVLSTIPEKRQIRLTLKKTLVNSDAEVWTSYKSLEPGLQAPGTLVNILPSGAVVHFYGSVRGFLPVSEMSESFIQDPKQHFRAGQVVNVRIVSVNSTEERMILSCKDPSIFGTAHQDAFKRLKPGEVVVGNVTEKTSEQIIVELEPSGLKAMLSIEHLADGSAQKCQSLATRVRVGQILKELLVLSKQEAKHQIRLTSKPSIIKATKNGRLMKTFEDVVEGSEVQGFVQNITPIGIFVQFASDLTGLLLKQHLPDEAALLLDFGMRRNQSISPRILSVDHRQRRFLLTLKALPDPKQSEGRKAEAADSYDMKLSNPVDEVSTSVEDFTLGKLTKARIVSIKETQMNVQLADAVQGRIDVSELFDSWKEINDRKSPLKKFHTKQILPVRILGMHDSRNHRFLPITHRGKAPVFELTAKSSSQISTDLDILTIDKVKAGSSWLVFVNNVADDCLWVNLSPNVRGRIRAMDVSNDVSQLNDLSKNFPVGSALRAKVLNVDLENNRLDLSARSDGSSVSLTLKDLSKGMVLPGRITKVTERQVMVQLSESLSAPIHLVELADDYSKVDPNAYEKNQTVRVWIKDIDVANKKIILSARPSKTLSSSLPVRDPDIGSITQLKINEIRRGFVKNVADNGIFVSLASNVTAFIRVSDLSDAFLKDWKSNFELDQLVEGKVIAVDSLLNHIQMSLKRSHLDKDYKPPLTFSDVKVGQTISGKVRKVEDFGVFVVVDDSSNVSGLCHRTKMSDQLGANPKKLYEEGDAVQAKILNINREKKQISFGLKASYFGKPSKGKEDDASDAGSVEASEAESASDSDESMGKANGVGLDASLEAQEDQYSDDEIDMDDVQDMNSDLLMNDGGADLPHEKSQGLNTTNGPRGLGTGGFDWTGGMSAGDDKDAQSETDIEASQPKKKKRRRAEIKIDKTGDLDANGPQSTADFERLLLGQPNSSVLWLGYMAFQLQLSEVSKAREVAERALKTINIREETEKMNVWIGLLNLENTYGSDESLDHIFKRACQYNDSQDIHERLISIYIQSGHDSKADDLFQATVKKHGKSPDLYLNYAKFLMTTLAAPDRARALLPRAMQSLASHTHLALTSKFAQLEFTSSNGDPERGRTVFETLLAQWPKRLDLWNVLLDLEMKQGDKDVIRRLFERVTGSGSSLKARQAKFFFKKWLEYESKEGDSKSQERVKALAADYVRAQGKQVDIE
ncbi:MAG: rRNA bioproteinsis protein rrp5 [Alectoria sarmentosa]|nr:MAG: rRNA bioproteinsis protein rrp5 [Alectoria sarmentosa]